MSDRLPEAVGVWKADSEQTFGETGRIGDLGEVLIHKILEELGFEVKHFPDDQARQLSGHDLVVIVNGVEYGIDAKTNLKGPDSDWHDTVCVDRGLLKSKARFYIHINKDDPTDYIIYKVSDMQEVCRAYPFIRNRHGKGGFFKVPRDVASSL